MDDKKLDLLLRYTKGGFHIFPLHNPHMDGCSCKEGVNCDRKGKHPRTHRGVKDASASAAQISEWHNLWPEANWALATGETSGVIVLDVDPKAGGEDSIAEYRIPLTPSVITGGGGKHYYFEQPDFVVKNSASKLGPGLDIRGYNGYVVIPPSLHESKSFYRWKVRPRDVGGFAELTEELYEKIREGSSRRIKADEDGYIEEGRRSNMLVSLAGWMRYRGFNQRALEPVLMSLNSTACNPPLSLEEVQKIIDSAIRNFERGEWK